MPKTRAGFRIRWRSIPKGSAASSQKSWSVGDRMMHSSFGEGEVTHTFGTGEKVSIAVKFSGMGPKILDPRLAPIEALEN